MFWKKKLPELYNEHELEVLENHISNYFGKFDNVLHEVMSPDIHVDICVIDPTPERNYYTLVTMGMGAHRMKVPKELKKAGIDRAEVLIALPPDWDIKNDDEKWYWPIRWLKILARLPGEHDSWLGYGHTVPNGEPFSDNTKLSGVMLSMPYYFGQAASVCALPNGDKINFYQIIALHESEMRYKIETSAEDLENLFPDDFDMVVDITRKSLVSNE